MSRRPYGGRGKVLSYLSYIIVFTLEATASCRFLLIYLTVSTWFWRCTVYVASPSRRAVSRDDYDFRARRSPCGRGGTSTLSAASEFWCGLWCYWVCCTWYCRACMLRSADHWHLLVYLSCFRAPNSKNEPHFYVQSLRNRIGLPLLKTDSSHLAVPHYNLYMARPI